MKFICPSCHKECSLILDDQDKTEFAEMMKGEVKPVSKVTKKVSD